MTGRVHVRQLKGTRWFNLQLMLPVEHMCVGFDFVFALSLFLSLSLSLSLSGKEVV